MVKRPVTITLDRNLEKKLRTLQASVIAASNANWSFSVITNLVLEEGLKHFSGKKMSKIERNNSR